jgi:hypothetical protein
MALPPLKVRLIQLLLQLRYSFYLIPLYIKKSVCQLTFFNIFRKIEIELVFVDKYQTEYIPFFLANYSLL